LEQAIAKMRASAASLRAKIAEMVEIPSASHPADRGVSLRTSWRLMVNVT
jgi:hypothetical protein